MMHGPEKSDLAIVATKPANKAGAPATERGEPRAGTEGNTGHPRTPRTQSRASVSPGLDRVRYTSPSDTRGRSRMREFRSSGSVRGVLRNGHPYRDICSQ